MNKKVTNLDPNNTTPELEQFGPETAFNHQHFIAEGAAGLLFHVISNNEDGFIPKSVLTSAIYSVDCAVNHMNKCFQAQLESDMANIEEMRSSESTRQIEIMELVAEFDDDQPQLRHDSIDAIKDGTTVEAFQNHVLRAISLKKAKASA